MCHRNHAAEGEPLRERIWATERETEELPEEEEEVAEERRPAVPTPSDD